MKRRNALMVMGAAVVRSLRSGENAPHSFGVRGDRSVLDGKPFVIRAGEMHYARVPREYWRDRMKKMRAMGLNTLCMYSFWNAHEPHPGQFDFTGNLDIAAFIRIAQEEGLWVIVRPGPYSCAEWEFGGYPSWLLKTPGIKLRSTDPRFLEPASNYMKRLLAHVAPLQITRGGPVLLVQVENEYGSFGSDKVYLNAIRKMIVDSGIEVPLDTSDGPRMDLLEGGTLPGVLSVVNFGGKPEPAFETFAKFRQGVPRMCGEYWVGWFDHWGEQHHRGNNAVHLAGIDWMLAHDISFSLYMVHGGTSWGFMAGANYHTAYAPTITSYDYDSPIDEAGRIAPKFYLFRDVIQKHLSPGETLPALPAPLPVIEIPRFELKESAPLFALLGEPAKAERPKTFEQLGQDYGFLLYRTKPQAPGRAKLEAKEVRDYALVMESGHTLATLDRRKSETTTEVTLSGTGPLEILVEAMGRINFGPRILDECKGITERVALNGTELTGWEMYSLALEDLGRLRFSRGHTTTAPAFYRAGFDLDETGDTYLDLRGWGKGYVWVNGRNLGRYWKIGPQQTLFLPGVWLRKGKNEVVVLDLFDAPVRSLAGVRDHVWETHEPA